MIEQEKKELGRWWIWITILFIASIILLGVTGTMSKWFSVAIEREIFESSVQRSVALESQLMAWEAQLASIESQLMTEPDNNNLIAQKRMLQVQINTTKGLQK